MQSFVANITGRAEHRTLDGREYLVVPVSMIVPGVLAGSKGPLYYPQERVARNASEWDGFPITLGHPSHVITNAPLSASDDGVLDRVGMGVLKDSKFSGGKLRTNAWLDAEKTKRLAPQVYEAALNGRPVEVSTGLFTQEVERHGTWNGRPYTHVVQDYTPDHLAVLTDQVGACSIKDGCGMSVNNASPTENAEDEGHWVTLPNGVHIEIKGGEVEKGPKIESKKDSGGKGKSKDDPLAAFRLPNGNLKMKDDKGNDVFDHPAYKAMADKKYAARDKADKQRTKEKKSEGRTDNESACPCGGTCRVCANAAATPKTAKPVKARPAVESGSAEAASRAAEYVENDDEDDEDGEPVENEDDPSLPSSEPKSIDPSVSPPDMPDMPTGNKNPEGKNQYKKGVKKPAEAEPHFEPIVSVALGDSQVAVSAPTDNDGCPCGGECKSCQTKNSDDETVSDGYEPSQPRCPIKKTFQPKGFKGTGSGAAHVAAKAGLEDTGVETVDHEDDETTVQNQSSDRVSSGLTNQGEPMKRQEMIQHLTTNCNCYRGKAGAVLNAMTDEQLDDLIVNANVVAQARKMVPGGATLATNAMPAALQDAMDKKKGGGKEKESPDEENDDEEEASPTKNQQKPLTMEEWMKVAPPDLRRMVRNNLARERQAKDGLIGVLVANVAEGSAKESLVNNYRRLDVEVLKAQVDALPTSNGGEFDLDEGGATYNGAALSGYDRGVTSNRLGNGEVIFEEPTFQNKN